MDNMNATPRTDDNEVFIFGDPQNRFFVKSSVSREIEYDLIDAQLEISNLKAAISLFCKSQEWADPLWKNQDHIAPLFKIAEKHETLPS